MNQKYNAENKAEKRDVEKRIESHLGKKEKNVPLRQGYLDICTWDKQWTRKTKRQYEKRREVNCALMLQQLIYWTDRTAPMTKNWVAKSAKDWEKETGLTESEVKSAQLKLKHLGFIEIKTSPFKAKNTTWYRIREGNIIEALKGRLEIQENEPEDQDRPPEDQVGEPVIH